MTAFSSEAELRKFLRQLRALTLGPMPWGEEEESLEEDQSCLFPPRVPQSERGRPCSCRGEEALGVWASGAGRVWGLKAQDKKRLRATRCLWTTERGSNVLG